MSPPETGGTFVMIQLLDMSVSLVGRARGTKRLFAQGARCAVCRLLNWCLLLLSKTDSFRHKCNQLQFSLFLWLQEPSFHIDCRLNRKFLRRLISFCSCPLSFDLARNICMTLPIILIIYVSFLKFVNLQSREIKSPSSIYSVTLWAAQGKFQAGLGNCGVDYCSTWFP